MFEALKEFENIQMKKMSNLPHSVKDASDGAINDKYLKGEIRIVTEQARYPLSQLKGLFDGVEYNRHPEFQRRHRWSIEKKSKLIESFIMNVPVPPIFLYETDFSEYEVMDGLQRISAIIEFYNDEYALENLDEWPELNGRKYSELPIQIKKGIDRRYISSIILLKETAKSETEAKRLKQLVFGRINSGGAKLEDQESRNAQYAGAFNDMTMRLARNSCFCEIFDIPQKTNGEDLANNIISDDLKYCKTFSTMKDAEYVLRFFALRMRNMWQDMSFSNFLDKYSECMLELPDAIIPQYEDLFSQTIELVYKVFGEYSFCQWKRNKQTQMFRWTKKASAFIYDSLMTSITNFIDKGNILIEKKETVVSRYKKMFEKDEELFNGRNTSQKSLNDRIGKFNSLFEEIVR